MNGAGAGGDDGQVVPQLVQDGQLHADHLSSRGGGVRWRHRTLNNRVGRYTNGHRDCTHRKENAAGLCFQRLGHIYMGLRITHKTLLGRT